MLRDVLRPAVLALLAAPLVAQAPGTEGGVGLALRARKILTCSWRGPQIVDGGVLLIENGKITAVDRADALEVPAGFETLDVGDRWLTPGMIDLHCHEAGPSIFDFLNDINDLVFLVNSDLRVAPSVEPGILPMKMAAAGGVTSVLYIPGSGSNIGGQGILLKTSFDRYDDCVIRNPGSLKLAQWGNPEAWTIGVGMSFENWDTRDALRRGVAYAERWRQFENGQGPEPKKDLLFEVFRDLVDGNIAISVHTQQYQVVLMTLTMIARDFGLPVFLDHSTIGGWLTGELAAELGVPAIVGPRSVDTTERRMINWARNKHEGVRGIARGYQERGLEMIGFNTDSPIIPQEQLSVNAAMGARYGLDDSRMATLRGLTIVPARAARIDHRVGSLEPGKDADVLVVTGNPTDPRTSVEITFIQGRRVYDAERDGRLW